MKHKSLFATELGIYGLDDREPAILTAWALGWPVRLVGHPGTAKTMLAERLSSAEHGRESVRIFNCPAENVLTIAGVPNVEAMKEGRFEFVHRTPDGTPSRFIYGKKNLVFNEFTRMNAEVQALLLEPFQERTFFDQPLPIKHRPDPRQIDFSIIATENPEGLGVRRMDSAILDRFYLVVDIPDGQDVMGVDTRKAIAMANLARHTWDGGRPNEALRRFARSLRHAYAELISSEEFAGSVAEYGAVLWELWFGSPMNDRPYISLRRQAMLSEVVAGLVAYRGLFTKLDAEAMEWATDQALTYCIFLPVRLSEEKQSILRKCSESAKPSLLRKVCSPKYVIQVELNSMTDVDRMLSYLSEKVDELVQWFDVAEREQVLGDAVGKLAAEDGRSDSGDHPKALGRVKSMLEILQKIGGHEELRRRVRLMAIDRVNSIVHVTASFNHYAYDEAQLERIGLARQAAKNIGTKWPIDVEVLSVLASVQAVSDGSSVLDTRSVIEKLADLALSRGDAEDFEEVEEWCREVLKRHGVL